MMAYPILRIVYNDHFRVYEVYNVYNGETWHSGTYVECLTFINDITAPYYNG